MATQTSVIETLFQTANADRTAGDFNAVTNAQTGLGNATTRTDQIMAGQNRTLGSLIGRFAVLTGSLFAVTGAFRSLQIASQVQDSFRGLDTLAGQAAQDGLAILDSVRETTKNQLTLDSAIKSINLSLASGFDSAQINALADSALRASIALGTDLQDAVSRITRATAKLEPELLDEIGIMTKVGRATRDYAESLGISVDELTQFQRSQAFVTAVIDEADRKFGDINTTVTTTSQTFAQLGVRVADILQQTGQSIGNFTAPIISGILDSPAAVATAIGLALSGATRIASPIISRASAKLGNSFVTSMASAAGDPELFTRRAFAGFDINTLQRSPAAQGLTNALGSLIVTSQRRALSSKEIRSLSDKAGQYVKEFERQFYKINSRLGRSDVLAERIGVSEDDFRQSAIRQSGIIRTSINQVAESQRILDNAVLDSQSIFVKAMSVMGVAAHTFGQVVRRVGLVLRTTFIFGPFALAGVAAFASLIGRGDDFNAKILEIKNNIGGLFSTSNLRARDLFSSLIGEAIEARETVEEQFKAIESFKLERRTRLFGFIPITISEERTKEQLGQELSRVMANISTDKSFFDRVFSTKSASLIGASAATGALVGALVGPVGASTGAVAGAVVGTVGAIGTAIYDSVTGAIEEIDKSRAKDVLGNAVFGSLDEDVAGRFGQVFREIEKKRDESLNPQTRGFFQRELDFLVDMVQYIPQLEAISSIAAATNESSAQIVNSYRLFKQEFDGFTATGGISSLFGEELTFEKITRDTEFMKAAYQQIGEEATRNLDTFITFTNSITNDSLRSYKLLSTAADEVISGGNVEKIEQGLANAGTNNLKIQRDIIGAIQHRTSVQEEATVAFNRGGREQFESLTQIVNETDRVLERNKENLSVLIAQKEFLDGQLEVLKQTEAFDTFAKRFGATDPFSAAFDAFTGAGLTDLEAIDLFGNESLENITKYRAETERTRAVLTDLQLEDQIPFTSNLSVANAQSFADRMNNIKGVTAEWNSELSRVSFVVNTLDNQTGDLVVRSGFLPIKTTDYVREAKKAVDIDNIRVRLAGQLVDRLTDLALNERKRIDENLEGIKNTIAEVDRELDGLVNEGKIISLQIDADVNRVNRELAQLNLGDQVAGLELQQETEARKINLGIGDFEKYASISKDLERKREEVVKTQLDGINANLEEEKRIIIAERDNDLKRVAASTRARVAQIEDERKLAVEDLNNKITFLKGVESLDENQIANLKRIYETFEGNLDALFTGVAKTLGQDFDVDLSAYEEPIRGVASGTIDELMRGIDQTNEAYGSLTDKIKQAGMQEQRNIFARAAGDVRVADKRAEIERREVTLAEEAAARKEAAEKAANERVIQDAILRAEMVKSQLLGIFNSVESNISNALQQINNLVLEGEDNSDTIGDVGKNLLKGIQKDIFRIAIADPVSRGTSNIISSIFGIDRKGLDNLTFRGDALKVFVEGTSPTTGLLGGAIDGGNKVQGFARKALSTGAGLFTNPISTIASFFASGGYVPRGYATGGTIQRDRVPAMLEPGEYVIKKTAVENFGRNNLASINANNGQGGMPQIQFNVINQSGEKLEPTETKTRFDGEKYIIDAVVKNIRQNGAIKKEMNGRSR